MVPFLVAALIVAAKAIRDSNTDDGERQNRGSGRDREPSQPASRDDGDESETYRGVRLTGSKKDRDTLKSTIDEYCKDPNDEREFKRTVKRLDANRDGRMGYSYKGGHVAVGVNFSEKHRLRSLAHEIGHERSPNGGEPAAEAYEADFIERRE